MQDARKKAQADWDEVSQLAVNLERASSAHQLAVQAAQSNKAAVQQRTELIARVRTSGEAARHAAALQASATSAHSEAAQRLNFASAAQAAAQKIASQHEAEAVIREADLKFRESEFALVLLQERLTNVREADADAANATAVVAASKITEKLRASIREAELALKTAHIAALRKLLENAAGSMDEARKERLKRVIETIQRELEEMKKNIK